MNNKKTWLVYITIQPGMGSEGWSSWAYHCVAFGDTDEEIYRNWAENVKKIYNVDLSNDLIYSNGQWRCYYYDIHKNELLTSVYGRAKELGIVATYSI